MVALGPEARLTRGQRRARRWSSIGSSRRRAAGVREPESTWIGPARRHALRGAGRPAAMPGWPIGPCRGPELARARPPRRWRGRLSGQTHRRGKRDQPTNREHDDRNDAESAEVGPTQPSVACWGQCTTGARGPTRRTRWPEATRVPPSAAPRGRPPATTGPPGRRAPAQWSRARLARSRRRHRRAGPGTSGSGPLEPRLARSIRSRHLPDLIVHPQQHSSTHRSNASRRSSRSGSRGRGSLDRVMSPGRRRAHCRPRRRVNPHRRTGVPEGDSSNGPGHRHRSGQRCRGGLKFKADMVPAMRRSRQTVELRRHGWEQPGASTWDVPTWRPSGLLRAPSPASWRPRRGERVIRRRRCVYVKK